MENKYHFIGNILIVIFLGNVAPAVGQSLPIGWDVLSEDTMPSIKRNLLNDTIIMPLGSFFGSGQFSVFSTFQSESIIDATPFKLITSARISQSFRIGEITPELTIQLNALDGKLNWQNSGIGLSFTNCTDRIAMQKKMLESWKKKEMTKLTDEAKGHLHAASISSNYLNHREMYSKKKAEMLSKLDSIEQDEFCKTEQADSLKQVYNQLGGLVQNVDSIKHHYDRNKFAIQKTVNTWNSKWKEKEKQLSSLSIYELLKELKLRQTNAVSKQVAFFSRLRQFELGSFVLQDSKFTLQDCRFNGLLIGPELKFGSFTFATGVEGQRPSFNQALHFDYFTTSQLAKKVLSIRGGIGTKQAGYMHFGLHFVKTRPNAHLGLTIAHNTIISGYAGQHLGERLMLTSEIHRSGFDETAQTTHVELIVQKSNVNNVAGNVQLETKFKSRVPNVFLSYERVGDGYFTLGNPFLLKGMESGTVGLKYSMFGGKLRLDLGLSKLKPIANSASIAGIRREQGYIKVHGAYKSWNWFAHSQPAVVRLGSEKNVQPPTTMVFMHMLGVGYLSKQTSSEKPIWVFNQTLSNYNMQSLTVDTSFVANLVYSSFNISRTGGYMQFSMNHTAGVDWKSKSVADLNVSADVRLLWWQKYIIPGIGVICIKRIYNQHLNSGLKGSAQARLGKRGSLFVDFAVLNRPVDNWKRDIFAQIGFTYSFNKS